MHMQHLDVKIRKNTNGVLKTIFYERVLFFQAHSVV